MLSFIGEHDTDKDRKTGCRDVEITGSHRHQMNLRHELILIALCVFFAPVIPLTTSSQPLRFMPCTVCSVKGIHHDEQQNIVRMCKTGI